MVERLVGSYALEAEIYQSLLALAQEQGAILEEGRDVDRCAALFDRKDEFLRSIASIERKIEPLKRRWWTEGVDAAGRERLNSLLDSILITIEAIMEQEERNEQLLLSRHEKIQAELGRAPRGAAADRTQADEELAPPFIDIPH